jgi:cystathionine beta-lyase
MTSVTKTLTEISTTASTTDDEQSAPTTSPSQKESPAKRRGYRLATEIVHLDSAQHQSQSQQENQHQTNRHYNASSMPIYQTATFFQQSANGSQEYDYSRSGNPTRSHVEHHLAKLMRASSAFAVSSGMSALDIILRLLKSGDEVVAGLDIYGGTQRLLTFISTQNNVKIVHVDTTIVSNVVDAVNERTRMVLLETPTNPLIQIVDLKGICDGVKQKYSDCLIVVDNTMMSPYLQRPLELGADIVYHSGTKYLSGHHDLMAGVIGVKDGIIGERIYFCINATGCGLAPFDCFLLTRGIKTLAVRIDRQQQNAMKIAKFLVERGFKVNYPGIESHPGYDVHRKQADGPGAVLSFETGSITRSEIIVEATRLWSISVSFGCVNSLISMPCRMSHASIPEKVRKERKLPEDLIRLCVGIEDADDLIEDLKQAIKKSAQ